MADGCGHARTPCEKAATKYRHVSSMSCTLRAFALWQLQNLTLQRLVQYEGAYASAQLLYCLNLLLQTMLYSANSIWSNAILLTLAVYHGLPKLFSHVITCSFRCSSGVSNALLAE